MYGTTYKKNMRFHVGAVLCELQNNDIATVRKKIIFCLMAATNEALQLSKLNLKIGWIMNMSPH
jgi:hypothetical protein